MKPTSTSSSRRAARLLALSVAAAFFGGGCGNKGPLYLPEAKSQARKPAAMVPAAPERPQPSQAAPEPK